MESRIESDYINEYDYSPPQQNKAGGYKNLSDACRHAAQCRGCKYYYCADDEMICCTNCVGNWICYMCSGISNLSWISICKSCYGYPDVKKQTCPTCARPRRTFLTNTKICLSCWRKDTLNSKISESKL